MSDVNLGTLVFHALEDVGQRKIRKIEGSFAYKGRIWDFKAYRIGAPQDIIRIDLHELGEVEK